MTIDVVIPVYGKWDLTRRCLQSLARQTVPHRVIVVDDVSPDDTVERLPAEFPGVDLVRMARNGGFGTACNAGIAAGDAELVVLMNNDVEAAPDMLERLAAPFAGDAALGSTVPLLLRPDGRVDAYGISVDPTLAGFVREQGRAPDAAQADEPRLAGPYGALAAYRRSALEDVGVFDEAIFMYGEELDLALRLAAGGWTTTAVPAARGTHLGGGTTGRGSRRQRELAGFGRGYLLRAYGVLRGRHGARALVTETIAAFGDAVLSRDLAALRGRLAGWRRGRTAQRRAWPTAAVDPEIGFRRSLALRVGDRAAG